MKSDAAAIIVAGGQGKRFGGRIRKQYLALLGRPILWWSLQAFRSSPTVRAIVLVVPKSDAARARRQFSSSDYRKPVHVVSGGKTRADSVRNGLAAVPASYSWIVVHDGVRPLVQPALIEAVLKEARSHRAAIAACPSKDTVKLANRRQTIQRTLPRQNVWLAQTPQAFERRLLERAHGFIKKSSRRSPLSKGGTGQSRLKLWGDLVTDDSQMVERLGIRVKLVNSPAENIKITVPADLLIARSVIARRRS